MNKDSVTLRDIYNAIGELRKELSGRIEKVEDDVVDINNWRNKLIGQFSVIMVLIGIGINYLWDFFVRK